MGSKDPELDKLKKELDTVIESIKVGGYVTISEMRMGRTVCVEKGSKYRPKSLGACVGSRHRWLIHC